MKPRPTPGDAARRTQARASPLFNQSLEKGLAVLLAFRQGGPHTEHGRAYGEAAAREFAPVEKRFENGARSWRQLVEADLFFGPQQDACAQPVGLHQPFHERDLIDADGEEELREFRETLFAQVSPAVEIVASRLVAGGEMSLVGIYIAREAARDRPTRLKFCLNVRLKVRHLQ